MLIKFIDAFHVEANNFYGFLFWNIKEIGLNSAFKFNKKLEIRNGKESIGWNKECF